LYPALILGPLFLLCWRAGKWRAFGTALAGAAGAWLVVPGQQVRGPQQPGPAGGGEGLEIGRGELRAGRPKPRCGPFGEPHRVPR
ncbi:hypothetical protein ACQ5JZ_28935, partial [Streptomyces sp. ZG43]